VLLVDGIWTQWTEWGVCSLTCGNNGTRTRTRICGFRIPTAPHGKNCTGGDTQTDSCLNTTDCPGNVGCQYAFTPL